jgi:uncharacterized membrane protein YdbT with pleckstrin-like domain
MAEENKEETTQKAEEAKQENTQEEKAPETEEKKEEDKEVKEKKHVSAGQVFGAIGKGVLKIGTIAAITFAAIKVYEDNK